MKTVLGYKKTQHSGKAFIGRVIRTPDKMYQCAKCDFNTSNIKSHFKVIYTNVKEG